MLSRIVSAEKPVMFAPSCDVPCWCYQLSMEWSRNFFRFPNVAHEHLARTRIYDVNSMLFWSCNAYTDRIIFAFAWRALAQESSFIRTQQSPYHSCRRYLMACLMLNIVLLIFYDFLASDPPFSLFCGRNTWFRILTFWGLRYPIVSWLLGVCHLNHLSVFWYLGFRHSAYLCVNPLFRPLGVFWFWFYHWPLGCILILNFANYFEHFVIKRTLLPPVC